MNGGETQLPASKRDLGSGGLMGVTNKNCSGQNLHRISINSRPAVNDAVGDAEQQGTIWSGLQKVRESFFPSIAEVVLWRLGGLLSR